jgi:dienelactone hydrolase/aminoglycoside phosphotransferase (APT) family kinase protein
MGEVYRATDTKLGREVALKLLPAEVARDTDRLARFQREAKALAALDHPNIVTVFSVEEADGVHFLTMQLVEGQPLDRLIPERGLSIERIVGLATALADALATAHEKGIVHRDLKPANIMLGPRGHVKVMDFGLAKLVKDAEKALSEEDTLTVLTKAGSTLGTLAYMSPEQLRGEAVDARSDIFSFGIVLYEMLAGVHPFRESSPMDIATGILNKEPAPLSTHVANCPPRLQETVSRMLAKRAADRGPGIAAVRAALSTLLQQLEQPDARASLLAALRRPAVWVPALVVLLALAAGGGWMVMRWQHQRWVRDVALPELRRLAEAGGIGQGAETVAAYRAAVALEKDLARDPEFTRILAQVSIETSIDTTPPGATVYARSYDEPEAPWEFLGTTPVSKRRVPLAPLRFRVEKPGYETLYRADFPGELDEETRGVGPRALAWTLDVEGTTPEDMAWVDASGGLPRLYSHNLPRFLIDRHEVTNRQFKAFVDAGGYRDRQFWTVAFVRDGRQIDWDAAMREFVDRTGRPGPSTWEGGTYPDGQEEFPVTGVSWYEAAAYAAFTGKQLPTVAHWEAAASQGHLMQAAMVSRSNFSGKGPVKVGSSPNSGFFDVLDMAGNAREWCWNEHVAGRAIRGGAWDDHAYMLTRITQAPAFDRSPRNGFRCIRQADGAQAPAKAFEPVPPAAFVRDYSKETPVSEPVFDALRRQYSYDPLPLDARAEARVEGGEWTREKVSFTAAYGGERVIAQLFLPVGVRSPYQVVIYFPGLLALTAGSSDSFEKAFEFYNNVLFLIRSGRAVVYPVYQGTHERRASVSPTSRQCKETHEYSAYSRQIVQDLRRTIDYLETRPDVDSSRIAFDGWSWGGEVAPRALAVETRFKAAIVIAGGLVASCRSLPDADALNFAPRVRTPVLMLHGRYDVTTPWETEGRPLYDLLGTPAPDKVLKLYDTDHFIPRVDLMKESLAWLDTYLGPVTR